MNISNIGQNISAVSVKSGNNIPRTTASETTDLSKDTSSQPKTIDMRNVSLNEINKLIRSGVDGLLDMVPFVSPQIIDQYGSEYAANIKVDFLGQVEGNIKFKKSMGEDTSFLENVLANLNKIDGMEMPSKIDVTA
jgi:hypothetical protein